MSGGQSLVDSGSAIMVKGVCWSTSSNPTVADNKSNDGAGMGDFNSSMTNLAPNTIYYVRAYVTNGAGTSYGDEQHDVFGQADLYHSNL